ncbi:unnamed protein product [Rotaria sp. Silwood1]|nr:unnamed protein product [Rotaria sp. Silwood1]CAF0960116.1 unnamed protein product [Rotaria sp. Silwood1]
MKHIPSNVKEKYEILGVIGEGSYGVVLKARKKDTNTTVAIKHFKQSPGYCTDMDIIERELKILQSLRFVNVVELIEWFRDKKQCFLIFEYVEWNMLQVLQEHPDGLPLEQVRQLSYQLFSAIHWCHTHEIIHRDIKPENLLISKNFILKLCDFGFARFCNTQTSADYYTDYVATRWYRSPELLIGSPYGKPVDIWACGCIMAELTTGQALFAGESDIDQLYRIQKCLGPLPSKYNEAIKTNPKFDGLKFPPIHHLETLERRYGHIFPPDIMHLFKGTLRLYAADRLTAEACIQHEAFVYLNQNQKQQQQKRLQRQQNRPKTVLGSLSTSQGQHDHHNEIVHFAMPLVDSRLSRWYDENGEIQIRRRSPTLPVHNGIDNLTDTSFAGSSTLIQHQQKYRSNTQMTDRSTNSHLQRHQSKFARAQSRNQSSSSDERIQITAVSPISSNNTSDDDDDPNSILSHHSRLRRKYIKNRQATPPPLSRQQSLREQQQQQQQQPLPPQPTSPSLRCASNGVLLRPKQHHTNNQHNTTNLFQKSSKDMSKKLKRFTLDTVENRWHHPYQTFSNNQQISESNIYRSSMAIVPSLNTNVYGSQMNNNNLLLTSVKQSQSQQRDESNNDLQQSRSKTRDLVRSRTIDCHPPSIETTPVLQRTPSRQNIITHHQISSDPMDQADVDTTISTTYSTSRSIEQQQQQQQQQQNNNNKHAWNSEQRKSAYGSDNYLVNSNGNNSSFSRPCYSPTKSDYAHVSKIVMAPQRESSYDLIKSAKSLVKQNTTTLPKTPIESNRRQQSSNNIFGVYPYARTAILHVANAIMPTSYQRQQSIRLPSTKSRHHDR